MGVRFFRGQKIKFEHEYRQLQEIVKILRREYSKEPVYLLTGLLVANGQIDCVILTKNGPLVLELKAFKGKIRGLENGNWEVETKDGKIPLPNLFLQAKIHRQDFIDRIIPLCRGQFPHIGEQNLRRTGSWLYFCEGSSYEDGQIDFRKVKWFRIATRSTLIEKMRFMDTGYTLRIQDMDAIVRGLHLEEYSFENDRPVPPSPPQLKRAIVSRRTAAILILILILFVGATALVLTVPGTRVAITNLIQGGSTLVGGVMKSVAKDSFKANSTPEDSQQAVIYLNRIRMGEGLSPLTYDPRAFQLALARSKDMAQFGYCNYTNPSTGSSAQTLKAGFGFSANETVLEAAYGQWNGYTLGIERQAIDSWIADQGNRDRLLFRQISGGVACTRGYCSFIGVIPGNAEPLSSLGDHSRISANSTLTIPGNDRNITGNNPANTPS